MTSRRLADARRLAAGRRGSEHGAGRVGEREHGRSRDAEAGRRGGARERSSDSGFRSESGGSSRYSSGALPPMGSSGLPLSPSQGPLPGGGSHKALGSCRRMPSRYIKSMSQTVLDVVSSCRGDSLGHRCCVVLLCGWKASGLHLC